MGDITNLKNKYNDNERETKNISQNKKPKFRGQGISGYARLAAPFAGKRYRLSPRQKTVQKNIRKLIAAGALTLFATTAAVVSQAQPKTDATVQEATINETLSKEDVLNSAESKLLEYIYGKNNSSIENANINYDIDKVENISSITVTNFVQLKQVTDFKHIHSSFFERKDENAEEINSMLDKMIDIYYDESPSQDDLQELNDDMKVLDDMNIEFDHINRTIINADEKDKNDNER